MGFLGTRGTKRKLRGVPSGDNRALAKRPRKRDAQGTTQPRHPGLLSLPAEILQDIFVHSGNLELPSVSRKLYSSLTGSQYLYRRFLDHHMAISDYEGLGLVICSLPVEFCTRRFVTVELLADMQIDSFTTQSDTSVLQPQLPPSLEEVRAVASRLDVITYLLEHGCRAGHSGNLLLSSVLHGDASVVQLLLDMNVPFDERSLIAALETQNHPVAKLLLAKSTNASLRESKDLWRYVTAKQSHSIFKLLTSSGVVPPLDVISC